MSSEQALGDTFEVLIIDDVCSFLTPRLVSSLREADKEVVGVFDPGDGPDAKRRLLECGISDVVEADASPEEFLALVSTLVVQRETVASAPRESKTCVVYVTGSPGVGVTEVAIAISAGLSGDARVMLVDLDLERPGVAQRLDLPLHPNLKTAIDFAHHEQSRLEEATHRVGSLSIVTGVPTSARTDSTPPAEIRALVHDLASSGFEYLVIDAGDRWEPAVAELASVALVIGGGSPVDLTRLVERASRISKAEGSAEILAVVNKSPTQLARSDDIKAELRKALRDIPVITVKQDRNVEASAWSGVVARRGSFARSMNRVARLVGRR
jgi:MinD-like ATPase involved in chromosome partitioning or flagellar assembly